MTHHVAPSFRAQAFNCPRCSAYAEQTWTNYKSPHGQQAYRELWTSRCAVCRQQAIWLGSEIVDPRVSSAPPPHPDMPDRVAALYAEAADVEHRSPRSAGALLRLALQELLAELAPGEFTIDKGIKSLVERGLDPQVQQAMDVMRVVGNNAVHPGEIDLDQEPDLIPAMYKLLNLIVEQIITRPSWVEGLFGALPERAREAIDRRDGRTRSADK